MEGKFIVALTLISMIGCGVHGATLEIKVVNGKPEFQQEVGKAAGAVFNFHGQAFIVQEGIAYSLFKPSDGSDAKDCGLPTAIDAKATLKTLTEYGKHDILCNAPEGCKKCNAKVNAECQITKESTKPQCACMKGYTANHEDYMKDKTKNAVECREVKWNDFNGKEAYKCGSNGNGKECNPIGLHNEDRIWPCCSMTGWCGFSTDHCCSHDECKNYAEIYGFNVKAQLEKQRAEAALKKSAKKQ